MTPAPGRARVPVRRTAPRRCPLASSRAGCRGSTGRERGSATVWVLACIAVLCVAASAALTLGAAVSMRHQAAGIADLAALAAAEQALGGAEVACGQAGRLVSHHRATLEACVLDGLVAQVQVAVPPRSAVQRRLSELAPARARARAAVTGPDPSAAPG